MSSVQEVKLHTFKPVRPPCNGVRYRDEHIHSRVNPEAQSGSECHGKSYTWSLSEGQNTQNWLVTHVSELTTAGVRAFWSRGRVLANIVWDALWSDGGASRPAIVQPLDAKSFCIGHHRF